MGRKKRTVQKRYLRRRKWAAVLVALVLLGGTALWALWEEEIRPFAAGLWH